MPREKGETLYVLRHELSGCCDEVESLKGVRRTLPWYFTLASAGASLALAGGIGLIAYGAAKEGQKPAHWTVYTFGSMLVIGVTAALILFVVGMLSQGSYDKEVDRIAKKLRALVYSKIPREQE
jgi:hypothetical protein